MKICFNYKTPHFERQLIILMGINDDAERFWGGGVRPQAEVLVVRETLTVVPGHMIT